jgi:glycosyltransferase involved in cell wall biosynthesis
MSAYACEPGKGSEPEVGWRWALQMARFHDVTVLTRANNAPAIQKELTRLEDTQPLPSFVYHDQDPIMLALKRRFHFIRFYYVYWQHTARRVISRLVQEETFDLLHHVTFATFRYPAAIWGHGVRCIWGPVGGIESIPVRLLPWGYPLPLLGELARNASNLVQTATPNVLRQRGLASALVLVTTPQMQEAFAEIGVASRLMATIGLEKESIPPLQDRAEPKGPLRLLYVGNLLALKGIDLALEALKESGIDAHLTVVGSGSFEAAAQKRTRRLGLAHRVQFKGRLPRAEVLGLYPRFDLFLFPSLHDTGGYAPMEAMANQLPVVCLDVGGPQLLVQPGCGIRVPLGSRKQVIGRLADALRFYHRDRATLVRHGRNAHDRVVKALDWDRKGEEMDAVYRGVCRPAEPRRLSVLLSAYACEPNKGSEPEVGWRWALSVARHHQVTVVTRANNKASVEAGLAHEPPPHPQFIYYDLPPWLLRWKRRWLSIPVYYLLWQAGVRWNLRKQLGQFDVVHHVTFNSFRQPGFWWFCPIPVILGPLGGGQVFPRRFATLLGENQFGELVRSLSVIASPLLLHLWVSFGAAARILVANRDTAKRVPALFRHKVSRLLETGMPAEIIPPRGREMEPPGNRIIWVSRLEGIKAPGLALRAVARARSQNSALRLTMVGPGPLREELERVNHQLGLDGAVDWKGRVPHAEVFSLLGQHDIFLFTSLRDTSGNVLLEAMAAGLPAVTLCHHGAAEITTDDTAIRVPVRTIAEAIAGLSDGLLKLAGSADLRERMAHAAQVRVAEVFAWDQKAERISAMYQAVVPARPRSEGAGSIVTPIESPPHSRTPP